MLYYYSITIWDGAEENYPSELHGVVAAKNIGKALNRVMKEYGCADEDVDEIKMVPFASLFDSGDIAELATINEYLNKNDD